MFQCGERATIKLDDPTLKGNSGMPSYRDDEAEIPPLGWVRL